MTYPQYWPAEPGDTSPVVKSLTTAFNWRSPDAPKLNASVAPTVYPAKRGPRAPSSSALAKRTETMLKPKDFKISGMTAPFTAGG